MFTTSGVDEKVGRITSRRDTRLGSGNEIASVARDDVWEIAREMSASLGRGTTSGLVPKLLKTEKSKPNRDEVWMSIIRALVIYEIRPTSPALDMVCGDEN
jgi:hypothetical protein